MRVLLADDDAARAGALARVLAADPALEVVRLPAGLALTEAVAQLAPDILIVDMARPDRDALDSIRRIAAAGLRPVALFVDQDDPAFMEEAIGAGVSSYNVLDVKPPDVKPILRAAVALFRRHQASEAAKASAEARLAERAVIDRAKALLMKRRRLSEPDAYRWLRRQAMDRGRRIADIAESLLAEEPP
ncbi:MAG: ANTAR domain-containing protein [Rhodospirillales bacterium]|nr:ANTAR domain-containing protein [Rhodospirillales bacterium]